MTKPMYLAALLALLTAAPALAHAPAPKPERQRLAEAVTVFLARDGSRCARDFTLVPGPHAGGWARAHISCPHTDDATVFLRRDGRGWKVVSLGTAWAPAELAKLGVPASLR